MQSALPIQLSAIQQTEFVPRSLAGKTALAVAATAFVALCAHVSIPLYFTPVPVTLQTLAVLLIGLLFGPGMGAATMALYLAEGAMGLPVFSPQGPGGIAQMLGPTAGFLLSYPLAALAAGAAGRALRSMQSQFSAGLMACIAATAIVFAMGAGWLAHLLHLGPGAAWHMGITPFLPGELLKVLAAAGLYSTYRRWRRA